MTEGPPRRILTGQADADATGRQRGQGEGLGGRPIQRMFSFGHFTPRLHSPFKFPVQMKPGGDFREPPEQAGEFFGFDTRFRLIARFGATGEAAPERRNRPVPLRTHFFGQRPGRLPTPHDAGDQCFQLPQP